MDIIAKLPPEARTREMRDLVHEHREEAARWKGRMEAIEDAQGKDVEWIRFRVKEEDVEGLSSVQAACVRRMASGRNIFVVGAAGVGKSRIIQAFHPPPLDSGHPSHVIAASTGKAAAQLGLEACTVHALWHDPRLSIIKTLVIDEAFMMNPDFLLGSFEARCREVRKCSAPFGGLGVICVGGPMQLPPIERGKPGDAWSVRQNTAMLHTNTERFAALFDEVFNLQTVHRQTDPFQLRILDKLRMGKKLSAREELFMRERSDVKEITLVPAVVGRCRMALAEDWESMGARMMVLFATRRSAGAFADACMDAAAAELGVGLHTFMVQMTVKVGLASKSVRKKKKKKPREEEEVERRGGGGGGDVKIGEEEVEYIPRKVWFQLQELIDKAADIEAGVDSTVKNAGKVDDTHRWLLTASRLLMVLKRMRAALRMKGWSRNMDLTRDSPPEDDMEDRSRCVPHFADLPVPLLCVAHEAYTRSMGSLRICRGMGVILRVNLCPEQGLMNGTRATVVGYVQHAPTYQEVVADARKAVYGKKKKGKEEEEEGEEEPVPEEEVENDGYDLHKRVRARVAKDVQLMAEEGEIALEPRSTWAHLEKASVVIRVDDGRRLVVPRCSTHADLYVPESCMHADGAGGSAMVRAGAQLWPEHTTVRVEATYVPCTPEAGSTIHGVQGLTCDGDVMLSLEGTFAPGQAYVGISRARDLSKVRFIGPWKQNAFFCHTGAAALVNALDEFPETHISASKVMAAYSAAYKRLGGGRGKVKR